LLFKWAIVCAIQNRVIVVIGIAHITGCITVGIGLCGVGIQWAIVCTIQNRVIVIIGIAHITECITIRVCLCGVGIQRAIIRTVENRIVVVIGIARITGCITICIRLCSVGSQWAIVCTIQNRIVVIIGITRIPCRHPYRYQFACYSEQPGSYHWHLARRQHRYQITHITEAISVCIFLARVNRHRTVICAIQHTVAIIIGITGIACAITVGIRLCERFAINGQLSVPSSTVSLSSSVSHASPNASPSVLVCGVGDQRTVICTIQYCVVIVIGIAIVTERIAIRIGLCGI
jgi:hypothetical protein